MYLVNVMLAVIKQTARYFTCILTDSTPKIDYASMPPVSNESLHILRQCCDVEYSDGGKTSTLIPKPRYRLFHGPLVEHRLCKPDNYYFHSYLQDQNILIYKKISW